MLTPYSPVFAEHLGLALQGVQNRSSAGGKANLPICYIARGSYLPGQNWHNIDPWKRPGRDDLSCEISEAFETALARMSKFGGSITDPADIPSAVDGSLWKCADTSRGLIVAADCKEYLGRYLRNLGGEGGCRSVEDIIA